MKKMNLILMLIVFFVFPVIVNADQIYTVDMDIEVLKNGEANITEVWKVKASSGSEWYKTMYDMEGSKISDFVVYMDNKKLIYKENWNTSDSISDKRGYYGINRTSDGIELCFGKGDMKEHIFTLKYKLSNYIFNTDDSQILYWTLMPKVTVDYFSVDITSYYPFPDTLDVWGYGYKGYAYVKNGKISMSEAISLNNDYVVLLVKFPLNTFDTEFRLSRYNSFQDVYKDANGGSFEYDYDEDAGSSIIDNKNDDEYNNVTGSNLGVWLVILFPFVFFFVLVFIAIGSIRNKYGYVDDKEINKKEVPMFRNIPCNKDIYYANILLKLNCFNYDKFNILGAIILKFVKEDRIRFENKEIGIFNRQTTVIVLVNNSNFDNKFEKKIYAIMKKASKDGILEVKELERWARSNHEDYLDLFDEIERWSISVLTSNNHIYKRLYKKECKSPFIMDDNIYNDSVELYGLKKYLIEFSKMDTKEIMEVKLWDEYLMFAFLFGIADKVSKQLKNMYPELLEHSDFNFDTIEYIDRISNRSISKAENAKYVDEQRELMRDVAKTAAENYSSGGGGYSRGGGGSGSRGGGSHGSMGGR